MQNNLGLFLSKRAFLSPDLEGYVEAVVVEVQLRHGRHVPLAVLADRPVGVDVGARLYDVRVDAGYASAMLPRGYVYESPVIKGADAKGIVEISKELGELSAKAREGKVDPLIGREIEIERLELEASFGRLETVGRLAELARTIA